MTPIELTHAYQHLAAQAAFGKAWAKMVEGAITDHALWLDRHTSAGDGVMHQVEQRQVDATPTATAQKADLTDAALRANVQSQDLAVSTWLDKSETALYAALSLLWTWGSASTPSRQRGRRRLQ